MTDPKKTKATAEELRCRVLKDKTHNHEGRDYKEGAEIDLSKERAQWLIGEKVVEVVK